MSLPKHEYKISTQNDDENEIQMLNQQNPIKKHLKQDYILIDIVYKHSQMLLGYDYWRIWYNVE